MFMFRRSYKRNIPLMAGVEFLGFLGITSFWILFLSQNRMSLLQIGLLESIFHATGIIYFDVDRAGKLLDLCSGNDFQCFVL